MSRIDDLQLVSLQKAAELLDVCDDTITRMLRRGDLRGTKVQRKIRVYLWSIDAYQKKNEITPVTEQAPAPNRPRAQLRSAGHRAALRDLKDLGFRNDSPPR